MKPGSHERAAEVAARALLQTGATLLQAKIGAHIASYGDTCFQSDTVLREAFRRWDGRKYHRGSIGRARRNGARAGWWTSKRVLPNEKPLKAEKKSTYGTTSKSFDWKRFGLRSPITKGENRKLRRQQNDEQRKPSQRRAAIPLEPGLLDLVDGIGPIPVPSARRRAPTLAERVQGLPAHVVRQERERSADSKLIETKNSALDALAAWARENEEPGPS